MFFTIFFFDKNIYIIVNGNVDSWQRYYLFYYYQVIICLLGPNWIRISPRYGFLHDSIHGQHNRVGINYFRKFYSVLDILAILSRFCDMFSFFSHLLTSYSSHELFICDLMICDSFKTQTYSIIVVQKISINVMKWWVKVNV